MYQTGVYKRTLTSTVGAVETELEAPIQDQDQYMGVYDLDLEGGGNKQNSTHSFSTQSKIKTKHTRSCNRQNYTYTTSALADLVARHKQRTRIGLGQSYRYRDKTPSRDQPRSGKVLSPFLCEQRFLIPLHLRSSRTGLCVRICLYSRAFRVPGRG